MWIILVGVSRIPYSHQMLHVCNLPLLIFRRAWMLARCRLCGASGTHRQCGNLETVANWACEPCRLVEKKGTLSCTTVTDQIETFLFPTTLLYFYHTTWKYTVYTCTYKYDCKT
jgi:hypothetical protein